MENNLAFRVRGLLSATALALAALFLAACPPPVTPPPPATYTVTYHGNGAVGGSVPVDSAAYKEGQTVTVLSNTGSLVKATFSDAGWNTQADGLGTSYAEGETFIMGSADVTLYVRWTALPTLTVTYSANGGSGSPPTDTTHYLQGQSVTVLGCGSLANTGLAFNGWSTQADGGGITYTQGQTFTMGSADVTLYAKWTAAAAYTVTYGANGAGGGTVPTDSTNYLEGQTVTVQGNTGSLVKTDFAFVGWNTQADGLGTTYAQSQTFPMGTSAVILYAKWAPTYIVTYDSNVATSGTAPADSNRYQLGQTYVVKSNTGSLVKTSFIFSGWNTQADGLGTTYNTGQSVPMGSANVTLFAKWNVPAVGSVIYDPNGATGGSVPEDLNTYTQGQTITVLPNSGNLVKAGSTYVGWNTAANGSGTTCSYGQTMTMGATPPLILYARWTTSAAHALTYDANGATAGSVPVTNTFYTSGQTVVVAGNIGGLGKPGYQFSGWNTASNGYGTDRAAGAVFSMGSVDVLLYAKWLPLIWTVAGTGSTTFAGDGGPATSANLWAPSAVLCDAAGNMFIADTQNHRIRKVDTGGTINTIAGTGYGYSGDNGPATAAQLAYPSGLAFDSAGNLYIADQSNHRIRRIDTGGTITTFAGTGVAGYSGDEAAATAAQLNLPMGVAVDAAGNVYVADTNNHCIRRIDTGGTITTIAGTGVAGYSGDLGPAASAQINHPMRVVVGLSGDLFIGDDKNYRVRRIDSGGTITTFAGTGVSGFSGDGGLATSAKFMAVTSLAIDAGGNLYIGDISTLRVRKVSSSDGKINTVAGNGGATGSGDGVPATSVDIGHPMGLSIDSGGYLYIADNWNCKIRKVSPP